MIILGQPIIIHDAVATLPAPSSANADEGAVVTQKTPAGRGYLEWELEFTADSATTLQDVTVYVRPGTGPWSALAVPGFGTVVFPTLSIDTIGVRARIDYLGLYDRVMVAATVAGGNVTVTATPVVRR